MRFFKVSFLGLLVCLSFMPALYAQDAAEQRHVRIRLLAERGGIKAGEAMAIAVEEAIAPGWHTYWKNPGDSGAAPRIRWTLPEGFSIGEIEWPAPRKLPMGPLVNYGYEDSATLLQNIKAPDILPEGRIVLKADIDILVCKEICIPESGTYELTLNAPGNDGQESDEDNSGYFENIRAAMPRSDAANATYTEQDGFFILEKHVGGEAGTAAGIDFIPEDWGIVENAAKPEITRAGGKLVIKQKRGERALDGIGQISGLLLVGTENGAPAASAYSFTAAPGEPPALQKSTAIPPHSLPYILFFAMLGGLILNLMPCVFPVLSIKALGLIKIAEKNPALARLHGVSYTGGVILCFLAIAGILVALKAGGAQIGWGFQLQNPQIIAALAYLFFVLGLNFSGLFEINGHFGSFGDRLTRGNTPAHSFFTGVLATLVATPCTAPFMGAALGFALVQPALVGLLVFAALGLGLALPYLALSFMPALQKILPRPGAWMETFRQILAFPMYASVAWLVWVLSQQSGPMGVLVVLLGVVLIAFGIWLLRHMPKTRLWHSIVRGLALLSFALAFLMIPAGIHKAAAPAIAGAENSSEEYSPEKLAEFLNGSDPVFVEMTAAWCITCKVNHALAIDTESTRKVFADNRVRYLVGDWTNQDPQITEYLRGFARNGVPIYVYYGPRDANGTRPEPVILPQILTPGIVANAVKGL